MGQIGLDGMDQQSVLWQSRDMIIFGMHDVPG